MSIFAVADLHLSFSSEKPMDIYGGEWINHTDKLKKNWESLITEKDTVILPGDSSWALKLDEALIDLEWIAKLPGKKVFVKGNHDLWWNSIGKLNRLDESMFFLQNTFYAADGYAICGTRGWICPGDDDFTAHDEKIYQRELGRLRLSLEEATKAGYSNLIGVLHFPPASDILMKSGFIELFEGYGVKKVVYGHLHGKDAYGNGFKGMKNKIEYILASIDYLKCMPVKII